MMHSIELLLSPQPEVLERVLRVTRHRGFTISELNMTVTESGEFKVNFTVNSDRVIELLTHQLGKLFDVINCQVVMPSKPQTASTCATA
ncbi:MULTISPECIES: acetolactate synthase 2 small subunit [Shewanella]|uniref:Acetolactate synthase II small subunit n=1 Tax=Shewanella japonica TaxID=93973 RepID=A0ABM6JR96_9GAMM|nr:MULTISPECIES: acetolactate synthase 2 small subunit [Shewanella]ARD24049.1 acetolactate synthase II small subunit [Shewanella japonica]MBQ4891295.1 acetolactate synthase 2 small subunit [Shewanella sp. MMG014]